MARPAGLEPAATGLEGRCSIQLSYGRTGELYPFCSGYDVACSGANRVLEIRDVHADRFVVERGRD
jgi:hypothetical protein